MNHKLDRYYRYLNTPFPFRLEQSISIKVIIIIGIINSVYVLLSNPYHIQKWIPEDTQPYFLGSLGLANIFIIIIYIHFIPNLFPLLFKCWTLIREVIFKSWILLSIASINYLLMTLLNTSPNTELHFGEVFIESTFWGVPLIIITSIIKVKYSPLSNKKLAIKMVNAFRNIKKVNEEIEVLTTAHTQNKKFAIKNILMIKRDGDFLEIISHNKPHSTRFKSSIYSIEPALIHIDELTEVQPDIWINVNKISKTKVDELGIQLYIEDYGFVTVERNFIEQLTI